MNQSESPTTQVTVRLTREPLSLVDMLATAVKNFNGMPINVT